MVEEALSFGKLWGSFEWVLSWGVDFFEGFLRPRSPGDPESRKASVVTNIFSKNLPETLNSVGSHFWILAKFWARLVRLREDLRFRMLGHGICCRLSPWMLIVAKGVAKDVAKACCKSKLYFSTPHRV